MHYHLVPLMVSLIFKLSVVYCLMSYVQYEIASSFLQLQVFLLKAIRNCNCLSSSAKNCLLSV